MFYSEFPPHPNLTRFIKCYWTIKADSPVTSLSHGVIPGGRTDLVFNIAEQIVDEESNRIFIEKAGSVLAGPCDSFRRFRSDGSFELFGVRFHIGRVPFSFAFRLADVRNWGIPLEQILHHRLKRQIQMLKRTIVQASDTGTRIAYLENFLMGLRAEWKDPDLTVSGALEIIQKSAGQASVDSLAAQLEVTVRQLERKFARHIGLSPKAFSRVIRFGYVNAILGTSADLPGVQLAYACGYSDQTHLIREFRSFTGFTPSSYERSRPVGFFLYGA